MPGSSADGRQMVPRSTPRKFGAQLAAAIGGAAARQCDHARRRRPRPGADDAAVAPARAGRGTARSRAFPGRARIHVARRRCGPRLHPARRRRDDAAPGARRRAGRPAALPKSTTSARRSASSPIASRCGRRRPRPSSPAGRATGASEVSLVANRLTDEADLTVLGGRSGRLGPDACGCPIRAKRAAAPTRARRRNPPHDRRRPPAAGRQQVGRVILCGNAAEAGEAAALGRRTGTAGRGVRRRGQRPPGWPRPGSRRQACRGSPRCWAWPWARPIAVPPVVDFLHVRRRAEPATHSPGSMRSRPRPPRDPLLRLWIICGSDAIDSCSELPAINAETAELEKTEQAVSESHGSTPPRSSAGWRPT